MHDIQGITLRLKKKAFPELSVRVSTEYAPMDDAFTSWNRSDEGYRIKVDMLMSAQPKEVTEGAVASNLATILYDSKLNRLSRLWNSTVRRLSEKKLADHETLMDMEVITRGLGPQLLAFAEYTERLDPPSLEDRTSEYSTEGLYARDIKRILAERNQSPIRPPGYA